MNETDYFKNKQYFSDLIEKKCSNYKRLSHILPKTERIVAIGDIHGDLDVLKKLLVSAQLIDENYNWIAIPSNTILVQVGDQLDSCRPGYDTCGVEGKYKDNVKGDLAVFAFLDELYKKAIEKGGLIINLLGNHELMNVDGNFQYISRNDIESLRNMKLIDINNNINQNIDKYELLKLRKLFFSKGNILANYLACTRQTAVIIGSNLFVHAGILPSLAKKYDIKQLNELISLWLLDSLNIDINQRNVGTVRDILYNSETSPFWSRIMGSIPKNENLDNLYCNQFIKPVLDTWEVGNIIIGHTPTFVKNEKLNSTCDNSLWRIDVGLSSTFKKKDKFNPQYLEIIDDTIFNIYEIINDECVKIN